MRRLFIWISRILLVLIVIAAVAGFWKREEIKRLWVVNSLFDADKIVQNFSSVDAAFLTTPVSRGDGPVSPLPKGPDLTLPPETEAWIRDRKVTSFLILHQGQIVHERYALGTTEQDRRISWSIAKSYLSALFGVLLDEGAIADLDDPVITYAPGLKDSAYRDATVRHVLNMASGVVFDEDYFDPKSDINRMGRIIALGGTLDDFTASFTESFAPPGETWKYTSIDTHVAGMILRGATGRSVADLLSEKVIAPLGLEQDGYYATDGSGAAFVLGGLNFTTRDYARFGQMILQDGAYGGQQVVPADWVTASTAASAPTEPGKVGYGYQWWIPVGASEGEFFGRGVYGQYLYFDRARDLVIVVTAADKAFREAGVHTGNIEFFRKIARNLVR